MRLPIQLQLFCPISVQDFYSLVPLLNNLNIRLQYVTTLLTKYSTKQTCLSLVRIMHWIERKPRWSTRREILLDWFKAFVHGFSNTSLYLEETVLR